MATLSDIRGVYTALVTPFTSDGSIDWKSFDRLLELQAAAEVAGVVISGTTGESPTLSVDEKISLFRRARSVLPHQVKVMAGTGGNCTKQSLELSKLAQDAGVDSLLVVTPPYNKPSREGLRAHFETIAQGVKIPICLYHVPGRTGQRLSPEDLGYLCQIEGVSAVKEASGDIALFSKAKQISSAAYLSGDDFTFLASLSVGGCGIISVLTNVFPKAFVTLQRSFEQGDQAKALLIHEALYSLIEQLFIESSPSPTKFLLSLDSQLTNTLRLPLVPVSNQSSLTLQAVMKLTQGKLREIGVL